MINIIQLWLKKGYVIRVDIFEKKIYDEITNSYKMNNISQDDYEEIFERFENMKYMSEVLPYIFAMRYLGLGTKAEKEKVMNELKELISKEDVMLNGLYYDLTLLENENDSDSKIKLNEYVNKGYSDIYLKSHSNISKVVKNSDMVKVSTNVEKDICESEAIKYKSMTFESCGYSGLYFTSGDIDYLSARVYIEPITTICKFNVRSQIFKDNKPISDIFSNEYILEQGTISFKTTGIGNEKFNAFRSGIYKWVIEIDGDDTYSQEFMVYGGKLTKSGIRVENVKLFESKSEGALEKDIDNYKAVFDAKNLEYIYFRFFIDTPGKKMYIQIFIKITYLEDNSIIFNEYMLQELCSDTYSFWEGVGYFETGKWEKGLYQYSVRIGNGQNQIGTFTVY